MNKYQTAVFEYFNQRQNDFIRTLIESNRGKCVVIDDMAVEAAKYLDDQIRYEMKYYEKWSSRYKFLTDMLIEVNVIEPGSDFELAILRAADKAFLNVRL